MTPPAINPAGQALYDHLAPLVADDEAHGWAALYLCSAVGVMVQHLDEVVSDTPTRPGWAAVLDPDAAPPAWLPWLAYLYGVTLVGGATVQEQRDTIRALPPHQRGTVAAMRAAAQATLTAPKQVTIVERDGGARRITVITYTPQTPDPVTTEAAIRVQKPARLLLNYRADPGWNVAQVEAAPYANAGALEAAFATVNDLEHHLP